MEWYPDWESCVIATFREIIQIAKEMLHQGYDEGDTEWMKKMLIKSDLNAMDDMKTALVNVVEKENLTFAHKIFQLPSFYTPEGDHPLTFVMCYGSEKFIERFFADPLHCKKINANLRGGSHGHTFGNTVLIIAAKRFPKLIPWLLEKGADVKYDINKKLLFELSGTRCQPSKDDSTTFIDIVQCLLDAGLEIRASESSEDSPFSELCKHIELMAIRFFCQPNEEIREPTFSQVIPSETKPVIENGRLLLSVYGSDIRDCVDFIALKCPNGELVLGLQEVVRLFQYDYNYSQLLERWEVNVVHNHVGIVLNCLLDLAKAILHYYEDVFTVEYFFIRMSLMYVLLQSVISAQRDPKFAGVIDVYVIRVLALTKQLTRFRTLRLFKDPHTFAQLLRSDCVHHLPLVEALIYHHTDKDGREILSTVKQKCESVNDTLPSETNALVMHILDSKLTTPLLLKDAARKCIVQSLGGTVRPETVHTLPLPLVLQNCILG